MISDTQTAATMGSSVSENPVAAKLNQSAVTDDEQDKFFDFSQATIHLKRLISDWHTEMEDTEVRRKTRDVEIDVEGLRQKGDLDEDETIIPMRVIDTNIIREQPPYMNYIKNSRRICTFRCLDNPQADSSQIEHEFTLGMTYTKWETSHFKEIDGAQTHGWDAVEVVYDESKPLHVGIEQIGHDRLIYPRSIGDLQQAPRICRAYDVTIIQLKRWVKNFGFDSTQVQRLLDKVRDTQKEPETIRIWKLFFKKDGIVYVAWFTIQEGCDDWLKKPEKLFVGIRTKQQVMAPTPGLDGTTEFIPTEQWTDSDVSLYPIFQLFYRETEKPKVNDHKGRTFLDEPKQEAQTAILSGFVNGLTRASNIYGAPGQEDGSGESLKELSDLKMVGGRILSKPMQFWHPDYPDPIIIKALQFFDVSNSNETNQVNFAAMNREDSRKTATEIGAAQQQQSLLNSTQLTLFSAHVREVYSFAWLIVQSQALQNKIKFLQIPIQQPQIGLDGQPLIDPSTGQPIMGQVVYVNNVELIGYSWELRAAGDVDVVQRLETEQKMQQDIPLVQGTSLYDIFLMDYLKLRYPDAGERYAQALSQNGMMQNMKALIGRMGTVMQGMMEQHPDMMDNVPQQQRADLSQMMQEAQAFMGGPSNA